MISFSIHNKKKSELIQMLLNIYKWHKDELPEYKHLTKIQLVNLIRDNEVKQLIKARSKARSRYGIHGNCKR